jgi:hypothetical protein
LLLLAGSHARAQLPGPADPTSLKPRLLNIDGVREWSSPNYHCSGENRARIAIVPSPVRIPRDGVRIVPVVHRGASIGRWTVAAWDARRFFAPYAEFFVKELVAATRRDYPGRNLVRRAPPLPPRRQSES